MTRQRKQSSLPAFLGAGLGVVVFVAVGALPGLLYGGYAGLMMAGALLGTPVEPSLLSEALTFGGMLLGLLASGSLFVVLGAICGSAMGAAGLFMVDAREALGARATPTASSGRVSPSGAGVTTDVASADRAA